MRLTTQIPSHDKNRLRCSTPAPECSNLFRLIKMLQSTESFFSLVYLYLPYFFIHMHIALTLNTYTQNLQLNVKHLRHIHGSIDESH